LVVVVVAMTQCSAISAGQLSQRSRNQLRNDHAKKNSVEMNFSIFWESSGNHLYNAAFFFLINNWRGERSAP
jgi:hypothetical protein